MNISGAIFDMDGTLTDSMYIWADVGVRYARSLGAEPGPDFQDIISTMTMREVAGYITEKFGVNMTVKDIREGINSLVEPMYRYEVGPKEGVIPLLEELKGRGVPMCVATATDKHLVELVLGRLDMLKYFEDIFTCAMVDAGKELPDVYEAALARLGTPKAETPVFEDALYAARTAKSAGFPLVAVFDPSEPNQEAMRELADLYIEDYASDFRL